MRDFYDIYVLSEKYNAVLNADIFKKAYEATCRKRESLHLLDMKLKSWRLSQMTMWSITDGQIIKVSFHLQMKYLLMKPLHALGN